MIDVVDEILNGEPLYNIIDSDGNVIYSGVKIELITELLQEGTPLNKLLFNSIKKDLELLEAKQSLVRKFNIPSVEIPTIVTQTTTPVPTTGWTVQSDNTYKSGEFTLSDSNIVNAFDSSSSTYWLVASGTTGILKLEKSIKLTTMTFSKRYDNSDIYSDSQALVIYGSKDGITWNQIASHTLNSNLTAMDYTAQVSVTLDINSSEFYKYYKFVAGSSNNEYRLYDINFTNYEISSGKDSNYLTLDIPIESYEEYMLCNVIIPSACDDNFEYKLDINGLSGQVIANALAGKEYVLRYENRMFKILQEV